MGFNGGSGTPCPSCGCNPERPCSCSGLGGGAAGGGPPGGGAPPGGNTIEKAGPNTLHIDVNYGTHRGEPPHILRSECLKLPLKSGEMLSLSWMQVGGNPLSPDYPGGTPQAGRYGRMAFDPILFFQSPGTVTAWENWSEGLTTYNASGIANQEATRTAFKVAPYYTVYESRLATYYEYWSVGLTSTDGRLNRVYDSHGNQLLYARRLQAANSVLDRIGGDLGRAIPYFEHYDDGNPNHLSVTKMHVADLDDPANSRTTYFNYGTGGTFLIMREIVYPEGCRQQYYSFHWPFSAATLVVSREVDPEGYATYFEYWQTPGDLTPVLSKVIEPEGRVTYFYYSLTAMDTRKTHLGRGTTYYFYQRSSSVDVGAMINCIVDPLGNATYWGYDASLSRHTRRIDPDGNITYYEYVGGSGSNRYAQTAMVSASSGGRSGYTTGGGGAPSTSYVMTGMTSPRHSAGYPVVTYYEYNSSLDRTLTMDPLGNTSRVAFDSLGRKTAVQDPRGNTTYFIYATATGHLDCRVEPDGSVAYFRYSSFRDLLREVSPRWPEQGFAAFTTYYAYDKRSHRTKKIDALGNITYFDWTSRGDLMDTVDAKGTTIANTYNGLRLKTQETITDSLGVQLAQSKHGYDIYKNRVRTLDPRGNATYFRFDAIDRLTAQQDALSNSTYYFYDKRSNLTVVLDARSNAVYYFYDSLARQTAMRDAVGNLVYYFYDVSDNRTHLLDPLRNATYFFYDKLDRLEATRDALGSSTYYFYDPTGNTTIVRDARFNSTYVAYDSRDRRSAMQDALGNVTYFGYDRASNQTQVLDARLGLAQFFYDPLNRLQSAIDPQGNSAYFFYDAVSNRTSLRDARGNAAYFRYDGLNRVTATQDAQGNVAYFFYDASGNRTASRNPNLHIVYFGYDGLNRLVRSQDALGASTYFQYDAVGNLTKVLDADVNVVQTRYDSVNRPDAIRMADGGSAYFFYDAASNRTKEVNSLGNATYYGYDSLDRLARIQDALARTLYFEYDAVSNLTRYMDSEGATSANAYDSLNRRTQTTYTTSGSVVSESLRAAPYYVYDQVGNVVQMGDLWGLHLMGYDADSRLTQHQYPNGSKVYFEYDAASNLITRVYPGAAGKACAEYDTINRQIRIQAPSGATVYFTYDAASNLAQRLLGNGAKLDVTYDAAERIASWRSSSLSGQALTYFDYSKDSKGLITKALRESTHTIYYSYDANDRLVAEIWSSTGTSEVYAFRYAYDAAGNRTRSRIKNGDSTVDTYFFYDQANQLKVTGTTSAWATPTYYMYDRNGSLTNLVDPSGTTYFAYNAAGLIARIQWQDASRTYFFYDGNLQRYAMVEAGATPASYFLWDGPNLLQELNADGSVKEEHTNAQMSIHGIGQLLETNRPGQVQAKLYPVMDARGTVTKWVESDGNTVFAGREYDSFGSIIRNSGTGTWPGRFGYQGQAWVEIFSGDGSQRLLLSPTRIYDPGTGRFLQNEILLSRRSLAHYLYSMQNPVTIVDPTGMQEAGPGWSNPYGLSQSGTAVLARQATVAVSTSTAASASTAGAATGTGLPVATAVAGGVLTIVTTVAAWWAYEPLNKQAPYVMPPSTMAGSYMRLYRPPEGQMPSPSPSPTPPPGYPAPQPNPGPNRGTQPSQPKCAKQRCDYYYEAIQPAPFTGEDVLVCYYLCADGSTVTRFKYPGDQCGLYVDEEM